MTIVRHCFCIYEWGPWPLDVRVPIFFTDVGREAACVLSKASDTSNVPTRWPRCIAQFQAPQVSAWKCGPGDWHWSDFVCTVYLVLQTRPPESWRMTELGQRAYLITFLQILIIQDGEGMYEFRAICLSQMKKVFTWNEITLVWLIFTFVCYNRRVM